MEFYFVCSNIFKSHKKKMSDILKAFFLCEYYEELLPF